MYRRLRQAIRLRPMHIRTQLTLLYMPVFAVLICLLGIVFYINLHSSLETNVDTELQEHAQGIASGIQYNNGKLSTQNLTSSFLGLIDDDSGSDVDTSSTTNTGSVIDNTPNLSTDVDVGPLVRILDGGRNPLFTSPAFQKLDIPSISVVQALQGDSWIGTVNATNGESVRLYSRPLEYHDSVVGVIQVGESLTTFGNTMRNAVIELLIIGAM